MKILTERAVQRTIVGIVGANLLVEALQVARRGRMPKLQALGEGTNRYVFKPSVGGGKALIHVEGPDRVRILKTAANRRQKHRIANELRLMFDEVSGADVQ